MINKRKLAAQWTAAALLFSMISGPAAVLAETSTASTQQTVTVSTKFTDVSQTHWALKHITKSSALGIIQGYDKGEFRPENPVSQQEVIVMAIRMMGLEDEVKQMTAETVLPFTVDTFFKPYIACAFDQGLINVAEETQASKSNSNWGRQEASREWVSKLVIRAIGQEQLASSLASSAPSFTDANKLSAWATGYVNAAVQLGVVQGFEDSSFRPQGSVTRAQMATFLSRAEKDMANKLPGISTGYVMNTANGKISVLDNEKQTTEYRITADTVIYNAKDDSRIPSSTIQLTNEVYIISSGGNALYIELINDQQLLERFEGTLDKVFLNEMIVSLKQADGEFKLYPLAPNVSIVDSSGKGLSIASISEGSIVELSRNPLLNEEDISRIVVKQAPISKQAAGTITSVDASNGKITLLEQPSGQTETYNIGNRTLITLQDGTTGTLAQIYPGDAVNYEIRANELVAVKVTKQTDVSVTETVKLTSMNLDDRIMTVSNANNELAAYYIEDGAQVIIDGMTNPSFQDMEPGDELELQLLNKKITKITVKSRTIQDIAFAQIVSYNEALKVLTLQHPDGALHAYTLTDKTKIVFAQNTITVSNFRTTFMDIPGKRVNLKVSKDKIVEIEHALEVDGTVTQVDAVKREVTVRTAGGQSLTLSVPSNIEIMRLTGESVGVSALKLGDQVRVTLTHTQNMAASIAVKSSGFFKVVYADRANRSVNVLGADNSAHVIIVGSNDKIVNPGKQTHAFEDIAVDEYVKADFVGSTLTKMVLLTASRGKATSIDANSGSITLQDNSGQIQALTVGKQPTINKLGVLGSDLAVISPNDRLTIVRDDMGNVMIYAATPIKKVFDSYDNVLNQLVFKAGTSTDKNRYNVDSKLYLHSGSQTLTLQQFASGDEVTIYVLDNKIIEMEK